MLLALLGSAALSNAQSFAEVNQRTLELYDGQNWPALIREGKSALQSGLDYLGLRYRLGVAYYESGRYFQSVRHFEQALQYDHANSYVLEYLYYSYLFAGREKDARRLAASFRPGLLEKTGVKPARLLDFIYLEGGAKQSSQPDSIGGIPFFSLGLRHRVDYRLDLYQSVGVLQQSYLQTDYQQWAYYLRGDWQIGAGVTLHPALHYVSLSGDILGGFQEGVMDPLTQSVWGGYLGLTIVSNRWRLHPHLAATRADTRVDYRLAVPPFQYLAVSNSTQAGFSLTYTPPIWHDRFWLNGQVGRHEVGGVSSTFWGAGLSMYLHKTLALHGHYFSSGGAVQFMEAQGAILNNAIDIMNDRWTANLEFRFGRQSSLLLGYQQEAKTFVDNSFYYNTFFLGLKLGL